LSLEAKSLFFFWGYPSSHKGLKLYDLETRTFFVSRDVFFQEHIFPFEHIRNADDEDASPNLRITEIGGLTEINVSSHTCLMILSPYKGRRRKISRKSNPITQSNNRISKMGLKVGRPHMHINRAKMTMGHPVPLCPHSLLNLCPPMSRLLSTRPRGSNPANQPKVNGPRGSHKSPSVEASVPHSRSSQ